jgi:transcriptional regulator of arginine metabolism
MNKSFRHGQIMRIIRTRKIHTQAELAEALKEGGIETTQVTLSRDIREMGLLKTPEGYRQIERESGPELATIAGEFLQDVRIAQNLIVLKTSPGNANTLAASLDSADWPEVVGTVAGDDTILVVTTDSETATKLRERFMAFLE